ncbi:dolichol phosphate-mannose biosynthesis regulatory [Gilbertella persicaria]|uniref:dolichol phosphate-mannose biosynthesis regulatory n=1 Tax=Gilbertella persicaria TaxID=101096 RepID=UPI00221FD6B6|nr:dolichol phosphate-mannose biosynthesis regulatory [Gilbertella persicaria]KAI8090287.1 dolichol phosphate-mannose biosynthesis regulatory [Gilbertella persicaria]
MGSSDKLVGGGACVAAAFIFVYYSTWTFIVPFLDESNSLHSLFLPYEYAIYLPAVVLVAGLSAITAFFIKATSKSKDKQKAK